MVEYVSVMNAQTRKQREIAEREQLVLGVAREMLADKGYLGITMDRIAAATEYSKGTIYQHFSCKEEILAALALEAVQKRIELFERGATFQGRPRERLAAIGMADDLFVRRYPQHFEIEKILTTSSLREKTSEIRQKALEAHDYRCFHAVVGTIRDGAAQGDLRLETPEIASHIAYGVWSMAFGSHLIAGSHDMDLEAKMGITDPEAVLWENFNRLLDGYDWKPLSSEWDYSATMDRIRTEVFSDELRNA